MGWPASNFELELELGMSFSLLHSGRFTFFIDEHKSYSFRENVPIFLVVLHNLFISPIHLSSPLLCLYVYELALDNGEVVDDVQNVLLNIHGE